MSQKAKPKGNVGAWLLNPKIGRRTGVDVKANKIIRKFNDGFENFDDYWTDSSEGEDSLASLLKEDEVDTPVTSVIGLGVKPLSPFSASSQTTVPSSASTLHDRTAETPVETPVNAEVETNSGSNNDHKRNKAMTGGRKASPLRLNPGGDALGTISRQETAKPLKMEPPGSALPVFRTKKRLTYSHGSDRDSIVSDTQKQSPTKSSKEKENDTPSFQEPSQAAPRRSKRSFHHESEKSPRVTRASVKDLQPRDTEAESEDPLDAITPKKRMSKSHAKSQKSPKVQPEKIPSKSPKQLKSPGKRNKNTTYVNDEPVEKEGNSIQEDDASNKTSTVVTDGSSPGNSSLNQSEILQTVSPVFVALERLKMKNPSVSKTVKTLSSKPTSKKPVAGEDEKINKKSVDEEPNHSPPREKTVVEEEKGGRHSETCVDSEDDEFEIVDTSFVVTHSPVKHKKVGNISTTYQRKSRSLSVANAGRSPAVLVKRKTQPGTKMPKLSGKRKMRKSDNSKLSRWFKTFSNEDSDSISFSSELSEGTNGEEGNDDGKLLKKNLEPRKYVKKTKSPKVKKNAATEVEKKNRSKAPSTKKASKSRGKSKVDKTHVVSEESIQDDENVFQSTKEVRPNDSVIKPVKRRQQNKRNKSLQVENEVTKHATLLTKKTSRGRKSSGNRKSVSSDLDNVDQSAINRKESRRNRSQAKGGEDEKVRKSRLSVVDKKNLVKAKEDENDEENYEDVWETIEGSESASDGDMGSVELEMEEIKETVKERRVREGIGKKGIEDMDNHFPNNVDHQKYIGDGDGPEEAEEVEVYDIVDVPSVQEINNNSYVIADKQSHNDDLSKIDSSSDHKKNLQKTSPAGTQVKKSKKGCQESVRRSCRPRVAPVAWYDNEVPDYSKALNLTESQREQCEPAPLRKRSSDISSPPQVSSSNDEFSPPINKKKKNKTKKLEVTVDKTKEIVETMEEESYAPPLGHRRRSILRRAGTPRTSVSYARFATDLPTYTPNVLSGKLTNYLPRYSTASPLHFNEMTCTQTPTRPDIKQGKTAKKIVKPSTPRNDMDVRRSKRTRVKALDWTRNERIVYEPRKSGGFVISSVAGSDDEEEVDREAALEKLLKKKRRKGKAPQTPRNLKVQKVVESNVDPRLQSGVVVINPDTLQEVEIDCVRSQETLSYRGPKLASFDDQDPFISTKALLQHAFSAGKLVIRPLRKKSRQVIKNGTMLFFVIHGKIALTLHRSSVIMESGDFFFVPRGNTYSLENLREQEAKLHFCHIKDGRDSQR